jgi:glycosyltransferase involved in cell wall biosynthesis
MANARSKVLLLIPHLGGGGAERVIELLARGLSEECFEVHLGVVCQTTDTAVNLLPHIHAHYLGALRVRAGWWQVLKLVRQLRPQLILSGMAHLNFLVLLLKMFYPRGVKVLVRQNGALPERSLSFNAAAYRLLYPLADGVIAQSEAMAVEISERLRIDAGKVRALNNPIVFPVNNSLSPSSDGTLRLLAVGRFVPEKGFDLLLSAFSNLLYKYSTIRLTLVGEGREKLRIEQIIDSLRLHNYAEPIGYRESPFETIHCDLFVLSSRSEGMPNALLEAASHGLPIVATPCSMSVTSLLAEKPGVWLAMDVSTDALEDALDAALNAIQPGMRFNHEFIAPFEYRRAVSAYEAYFNEFLAR